MFWKKIGQVHSASKLFTQANEYWQRRKSLLLQQDDNGAKQSCAEVIRLCQLALQSDKQMGNAYILLANALLSEASELSKSTYPEKYEFLFMRGVAVIQQWYSLPHRGYPITKNPEIGEWLWKTTLDQLMQDKRFPENEAIKRMNLYRDNHALNTMSPTSYPEIQKIVLGDKPLPKKEQNRHTSQADRQVNAILETYRNAQWGPTMVEVLDILKKIGVGAVEPLIYALRDKDAKIRMIAAYSLGELDDTRAVETLIKALQDEDESVREQASYSLGLLGDNRAIEPLISALKDKNNMVRHQAGDALENFKDARVVEPLIEALNDTDEYVRRTAASSLGKVGDVRAIEPLIHALKDESKEVRFLASDSLGELGDIRAVEPLILSLKDVDADVRGRTARSLGKLGDIRAVEPLKILLNDENQYVREAATKVIYEIKREK